jgi:hypothetical protein
MYDFVYHSVRRSVRDSHWSRDYRDGTAIRVFYENPGFYMTQHGWVQKCDHGDGLAAACDIKLFTKVLTLKDTHACLVPLFKDLYVFILFFMTWSLDAVLPFWICSKICMHSFCSLGHGVWMRYCHLVDSLTFICSDTELVVHYIYRGPQYTHGRHYFHGLVDHILVHTWNSWSYISTILVCDSNERNPSIDSLCISVYYDYNTSSLGWGWLLLSESVVFVNGDKTINVGDNYAYPSNKSRRTVEQSDMNCICHIVTIEDEHFISASKLVCLARACGNPVTIGNKCGSK